MLFSWAIRSSYLSAVSMSLETSCKFCRCSCLVKHMYNTAAPSCASACVFSSALLLQSFPSDSGDRRCSVLFWCSEIESESKGKRASIRVHQRGLSYCFKHPFPSIYFHFQAVCDMKIAGKSTEFANARAEHWYLVT